MTTPSLPEVIRGAVEFRLKDVHKIIPGKFESFDGTMASVKPQVKRQKEDGTFESMPVVVNVPVTFMSAGGATLTMPIKKGDECLIFFCDRSIDEWLSNGDESEPKDPRIHDDTDAYAMPCGTSFASISEADLDDVVLSFAGSEFRIKKSGDIFAQNGPSKLNLTKAKATIEAFQIAFGSPAVELLDIVIQALDTLGTTTSGAAQVPLKDAALFTNLASKLKTIKGTL